MKKQIELRFEKVDEHTIRIIKVIEHIDEVPLAKIIANKTGLFGAKEAMKTEVSTQNKIIDERLANIEKILKEADGLGITAKAPEKPKPKTSEGKK